MIKLTKEDKRDMKLIKDLEKSILVNFGKKCRDHEEECVICSVYKALNELQLAYGYEYGTKL
jgi:hypothetical protein